jgi:methyl-accepting chemotaxis protein
MASSEHAGRAAIAISFRMPLVQMRLDRLGDNFYYLGFIYTLASLTAALIQLSGGIRIEPLLQSFGIALVTTIVGISGRVVFVQLRSNLDDIDERVRRDLAATSAELRGQLGQSIRDFEAFRTTLLQVLVETKEEYVKAQEQQIEHVKSLAETAAKQIDDAFDVNRVHSKRLTDSVEAVAKSVERATEKLAGMQLPSDRLNSELVDFAQKLEALILRLGHLVEDAAQRSLRKRRWFSRFRR